MLRIDIIENLVHNFSKEFTYSEIIDNPTLGISSIDISEKLNILRNNASSDLNKLNKLGKLIKITGKPTKYFHKEVLENIFSHSLTTDNLSGKNLLDFIDLTNFNLSSASKIDDPFSTLIGANQSLSSIIKLAKSSILYPNGLNTLLLGESGVGKSLFAELMYEYGVINKIFKEDSSFVVFNCADYANNANLLVAQLFGCKKGSYTGADTDREGLIETANGGVLFLDEVHRLPPEGQEMLFLFMDKKKFRRLGEVSNNRTSNVLIIAATTENPSSALLTTFIRRIPASIKIPNLKARSLNEKLNLVNTLYSIESRKINKNISVNMQTISKLIVYNPAGNIGQLTSDIQLSVARAYLDSKINNYNIVKITDDYLPFYTTNIFTNLDISTRQNIALLLTENEYMFYPNNKLKFKPTTTPYDFVKFYTDKSKANEELSIQDIFESYAKTIAKDIVSSNPYPDFIDDEISEIVSTLSDILYKDLNLILDKSSYIALALYLKSLRDDSTIIKHTNNSLDIQTIPNSIITLSKKIIKTLETRFNIYCNNDDNYTLSVIINSFKNKEIFDPVGIMIVAHGDSLATNISSVANNLLGIDFAIPIDMPLTVAPDKTLEVLIENINDRNFSRGLIIFADMGSITNFDDIIKTRTGVSTVTLNSINILLVIESIRKSIFQKDDLNDILYNLIGMNNRLSSDFTKRIETHLSISKKRLVYTVCNSGEGVAFYLQETIKDMLKDFNIYDVDIMPLNVENKKQLRDIINQTLVDKEGISILGSIDPDFNNIPFISLEDVLLHNGLEKLLTLLGVKTSFDPNKVLVKKSNRSLTISITCDAVNKYLTVLSSEKLKPTILDFIFILERDLKISLPNECLTKLFIHISCMIERILLKDFILTSQEEIIKYINKNKKLVTIIKSALFCFEENYTVTIPENEIYYITEIIKPYINKF